MIREIDLHGFRIYEIKPYLDTCINNFSKDVREVHIIHGWQQGSAIQTFVRKQYHHKRIKRIILTLNPGETVFVLK